MSTIQKETRAEGRELSSKREPKVSGSNEIGARNYGK
jgi:hypothetical protein